MKVLFESSFLCGAGVKLATSEQRNTRGQFLFNKHLFKEFLLSFMGHLQYSRLRLHKQLCYGIRESVLSSQILLFDQSELYKLVKRPPLKHTINKAKRQHVASLRKALTGQQLIHIDVRAIYQNCEKLGFRELKSRPTTEGINILFQVPFGRRWSLSSALLVKDPPDVKKEG